MKLGICVPTSIPFTNFFWLKAILNLALGIALGLHGPLLTGP